MKYLNKSLMAIVLATSLLFAPGCASTGGVDMMPDDPAQQEQVIKDVGQILNVAARNAALIALNKHPEKARQYINLAVDVMDTMILKQDSSPSTLSSSLVPIIKEAEELETKLAINTALDLYQVLYGRHIKKNFPSDHPYAMLLIRNVREGAASALDQTALRQSGA